MTPGISVPAFGPSRSLQHLATSRAAFGARRLVVIDTETSAFFFNRHSSICEPAQNG